MGHLEATTVRSWTQRHARLLAIILTFLSRESWAGTAARPDSRPELPEYDLAVHLIPDAHRIEVSGTLSLPPSGEPRAQLDLYLSEQMSAFQIEALDPGGSSTALEKAKTTDGDHIDHWVLRPREPFPAGKPVRLRFSYAGGGAIAYTFYLGPEGSFAGQGSFWYPRFANAQGRIAFSVPPGWTVLSTGARRSLASDESKGDFVFSNTVPTRFAFAAAKYTVLTQAGVVPMRLYLLRPRPNAAEYLAGASRVLSTLSQEFGPYPYAGFSIAEVPPEQARQASFTGASMNGFILADSAALDSPFNLAYYGHEIGHQWWANLVTHEGPRGSYMLDEAMAQFGSLQVVAALEGPLAAEQFRRSGYPGYSTAGCGSGYLLSTANGMDHALGDLPPDNWSHELADSKGFLVLDLLAETIGRERFREVLRGITATYAFRSVTWEKFLSAVQRASAEDLGWFFTQWFGRTGAPDWTSTWKQDGRGVHLEIAQLPPLYRMRLEVELTGQDGRLATRTVDVKEERTEVSWTTDLKVRSVTLDPHFHVLHWLPELRAGAAARGPAFRAFQLSDAGKYEEAEAVLKKALDNLPQPDGHGAQYWTEYALAYLFAAKKDWAQAERHFDAAIAAPSRDLDTLPFLFCRYAQMSKTRHDDAKLRWAVDAAISADAAAGGRTGASYWARSFLAPNQH